MKGIFERGDSFQVKKRVGGADIRGTFKTKGAAETYIRECELAHAKGLPFPAPTGTTKDIRLVAVRDIFEETAALVWAGNRTSASQDNGWQFVKWVGPATPVRDAFSQDKVNAYVIARAR
jgi:hypothetical protein